MLLRSLVVGIHGTDCFFQIRLDGRHHGQGRGNLGLSDIRLNLAVYNLVCTVGNLGSHLVLAVFHRLFAVFDLLLGVVQFILCINKFLFDLFNNIFVDFIDFILIQRDLNGFLHGSDGRNRSYTLHTFQIRYNGIVHIVGDLNLRHVIYICRSNHNRNHGRVKLHDQGTLHTAGESSLNLVEFLLHFNNDGIHVGILLIFKDNHGCTVIRHGLYGLDVRRCRHLRLDGCRDIFLHFLGTSAGIGRNYQNIG